MSNKTTGRGKLRDTFGGKLRDFENLISLQIWQKLKIWAKMINFGKKWYILTFFYIWIFFTTSQFGTTGNLWKFPSDFVWKKELRTGFPPHFVMNGNKKDLIVYLLIIEKLDPSPFCLGTMLRYGNRRDKHYIQWGHIWIWYHTQGGIINCKGPK